MPLGGWEGPMEEVGRMLREKEGKRGHSRERTAWVVAPQDWAGHFLRGKRWHVWTYVEMRSRSWMRREESPWPLSEGPREPQRS